MSESLAVNLITYGTVLGLSTGSLNESVRKGLTLSLSAESTVLCYSTGSLSPNVLAFLNSGDIVVVTAADDTVDGITRGEYE